MVEAQPLPGGIGAEIRGLDLSQPIGATARGALVEAWLEHAILLFRGIGTSTNRHLDLSRVFGELEVHPIETIRLPGSEEIIHLTHKGDETQSLHYFDGKPVVGRIPWHTDMIYTTTPNRGALLRMVEKPATGGQTGWIDMAAAFDALPGPLLRQIEGVEARFDFVADPCDMRFGKPARIEHGEAGTVEFPPFPEVAHPLVWTHPESGRKSLCLSPVQLIEVVGQPRAQGDPLLEALVAHTLEGPFRYVHDWEVGDMVLWDNWRTMHTALGTPPGESRVVHRTTIRGTHPTGRLL